MPAEIAILGAGPVGCTLALALLRAGRAPWLCARRAPGGTRPQFRPIALSHASRLILERVGALEALAATPIETIHVSQAGSLGRTRITAQDAGVPALGYVVDYGALGEALYARAEAKGVRIAPAPEEAMLTVHAEGASLRVGVRAIRVDPIDENTIYTLGLGLNVSRDAGKTFTTLRGMHGDHHGLWIDPANPAVLYNANDGGFYRSTDAGKTWAYDVAAGGIQFYNVTLDNSTPVWAYGSIQDYGSRRGVVDLSRGRDRVPAQAFTNAPGGEGSRHAIDPRDPNVVYSAGFYHNISRSELGALDARGRPASTSITPRLDAAAGVLRGQWLSPLLLSTAVSAELKL